MEQRQAEIAGKLREPGPSSLDADEHAEIARLLPDARALRSQIAGYSGPAL